MNAIPPINSSIAPDVSDNNPLVTSLNQVAEYCLLYTEESYLFPNTDPSTVLGYSQAMATLQSLCPPNSTNATWTALEGICPKTSNAQSQLNFLQGILHPPFNQSTVLQDPSMLMVAIATVIGSIQ